MVVPTRLATSTWRGELIGVAAAGVALNGFSMWRAGDSGSVEENYTGARAARTKCGDSSPSCLRVRMTDETFVSRKIRDKPLTRRVDGRDAHEYYGAVIGIRGLPLGQQRQDRRDRGATLQQAEIDAVFVQQG